MFKYFIHFLTFSIIVLLRGSLFGSPSDTDAFYWAADLGSGVPNAFQSPTNFTEVIGFEKEIADAIAKEMGKKSVLVENEWEGLIPGLQKRRYDAVINGINVTPERQDVVAFSKSYLVSYQQLVINKRREEIQSLDDCAGLTVGTLRSSEAAHYLESYYPSIKRSLYTVELSIFNDLAHGRIDAILIDAPVAIYYSAIDPKLKIVGEPIDRIEYAVALRKEDKELLTQVNQAIDTLIANGTIRNILERWNLWNPFVAQTFNDLSPSGQAPVEYESFLDNYFSASKSWMNKIVQYLSFLPLLGKGALMTLKLSIIAMFFAMIIGFFLAVARVYGPRPLAIFAKAYIEIVRGTPLLIQLYFIFYGLPSVGIQFNPFMAGVIALGINYSAYEAENYRAGILSVPHGQMEAARALGMTHWEGIRHVVFPQAFRVMLPPVTNDFISLLKDSSLVSVITIVDLTFAYNMLSATYYNFFTLGIIVAFMYFLLGLPFLQLARWTERKLAFDTKKRNQPRVR